MASEKWHHYQIVWISPRGQTSGQEWNTAPGCGGGSRYRGSESASTRPRRCHRDNSHLRVKVTGSDSVEDRGQYYGISVVLSVLDPFFFFSKLRLPSASFKSLHVIWNIWKTRSREERRENPVETLRNPLLPSDLLLRAKSVLGRRHLHVQSQLHSDTLIV